MQNFLQNIPVWDVLEITGIVAALVLLIQKNINPVLAKADEFIDEKKEFVAENLYVTPKVIDALTNGTPMEFTPEETEAIAKAVVDRLTGATDA
jgi:hypothetical protein